jgi:DNA-binding LacI/PurR family transcriptional regulator
MPQQLYCSVGGDNVGGGLLATRHLLQRGCRRIVFLGDPELPEAGLRQQGHEQALAEAGVPSMAELHLPVPFDAAAARTALNGLLDRGLPFDGLFACSDVLAMAAVQVLRSRGLAVPQQVPVVGYDDIEWASHADPPLTTVRQPIAAAGVEIVDALLAIMAGAAMEPRTLAVELVVRQSA